MSGKMKMRERGLRPGPRGRNAVSNGDQRQRQRQKHRQREREREREREEGELCAFASRDNLATLKHPEEPSKEIPRPGSCVTTPLDACVCVR